jgi:hypothetical protein
MPLSPKLFSQTKAGLLENKQTVVRDFDPSGFDPNPSSGGG